MSEPRPDGPRARDLLVQELTKRYEVSLIDDSGFSLARDGKVVRVELAADQLDTYLTQVEDSAHNDIGLEARWRSALSLTAVHVTEEVAMAEPGMSVVVDGAEIRRDPPPDPTVAADAGAVRREWSVRTPLSGQTRRFDAEGC